jgi:hypothetical protein
MPYDLPPYIFSLDQDVSNVLFLGSRWIDAATVAASSEEGLLTADLVQTIRPDQVWRATGCAAEYLTWDFGEAIEVEALVALAHNLSEDATLRLRLAASAVDVTAAPAIDTGFVSAWPISGKPEDPGESPFSLVLTESGIGYRYGRLDIVDPTNADGYVQIGRLFVGPAFVPAINVDINPSFGLISPDEVGRTAFGHAFGDNRGPAARVMQLPMSALDEDELGDELFELQRYCGLAKDFAVCLNPAATQRFHRYSMQARFASLNLFTGQPAVNEAGTQVWQTTLAIEEIL